MSKNFPQETNQYYQVESERAINAAIEQSAGKSPEEVRFAIRRAYPFELPRKGRPYKAWCKAVHAKEKELGFEPRKHKRRTQPAPTPTTPAGERIESTVAHRWEHMEKRSV